MTNPDNAGGLPELPKPYRLASIVRNVALFNGGLIADDLAKVEAFLANLDEAANRVYRLIPTLPVTAENINAATRAMTQFCYDFQPLIRDVVDAAPAGAETGNPVSEQNQQDSAPAGGDVERDADFYSAGYANGYKHATKDSAPAVSGEVEAMATIVQALELASIICDSVPTRIHEVAEDGWQKRLGELVNRQDENRHGYAVIHRALAAIKRGGFGWHSPRMEHDAEEAECVHLSLDKEGVPRADESGAVYSLWGRVALLRKLSQGADENSLRVVAKRNLRSLINIGSSDKELMLKCLEELS